MMRHTFVTRLAENPDVSDEMIRQLAGHVSPRRLAQYAHSRVQVRGTAIASLEEAPDSVGSRDFEGESPQNPPRSADSPFRTLN